MFNIQARNIATPNVVVGMALFVGGLAQFVAGMWEFACANSFGATGEQRSPSLFLPSLFPASIFFCLPARATPHEPALRLRRSI